MRVADPSRRLRNGFIWTAVGAVAGAAIGAAVCPDRPNEGHGYTLIGPGLAIGAGAGALSSNTVLVEALAEAFSKQEIWGPLGMTDTTYNPSPALVPRCAATGPGLLNLRPGPLRGAVQDDQDWKVGGIVGCDEVGGETLRYVADGRCRPSDYHNELCAGATFR